MFDGLHRTIMNGRGVVVDDVNRPKSEIKLRGAYVMPLMQQGAMPQHQPVAPTIGRRKFESDNLPFPSAEQRHLPLSAAPESMI